MAAVCLVLVVGHGATTAYGSARSSCPGDCNGRAGVTIAELVRIVNVATGAESIEQCPAADVNDDRLVTIDEIIRAVAAALTGCVQPLSEGFLVADFHRGEMPVGFDWTSTHRSSGRTYLGGWQGDLWATDGTEGGTVLVRRGVPGQFGATVTEFAAAGDRLLFRSGRYLWGTNGTAAGTRRVGKVYFNSPTSIGDVVIFNGADSAGSELWVSDGTLPGTKLLKDLAPGGAGGVPRPLRGLDGLGFFTANRTGLPTDGREAWVTDGTSGGTQRLTDLAPAIGFPNRLLGTWGRRGVISNHSGSAVWVSDGTRDGTKLFVELDDIGGGVVRPPGLSIAVGDRLALLTTEGIISTDGTPEGTAPLPIGLTRNHIEVDGVLYMAASGRLWRTDGTTEGSFEIHSAAASCIACVTNPEGGATVLFAAETVDAGSELWASDGTSEGSRLLADIAQGPDDSNLWLCDYSGIDDCPASVVFVADDGIHGTEPWVTDGTPSGTHMVKNLEPDVGSGDPTHVVVLGNDLFAIATDSDDRRGVAKVDGANGDVSSYATGGLPVRLASTSEGIFFLSFDEDGATHLWAGDGGSDPAPLVEPVSFRSSLIATDEIVYFSSGRELWRSDGTSEGTFRLFDGNGSGFKMAAVNGILYFENARGSQGLHRSDGTPAGTVKLTDVSAGAVAAGDRTFAIFSHQLWRIDGIELVPIVDFDPATGAIIRGAGGAADRLFFHVVDPTGGSLWVSDGTASGSTKVTEYPPGRTDQIGQIFPVCGGVVFVYEAADTGRELWGSDGSVRGTRLLADIRPGPGSSLPSELRAVGGRVYFQACTEVVGCEPWITDGTEAGTALLADIRPGVGSSTPREFVEAGGRLVFSADDGQRGRELWGIPLEDAACAR